MAAVVLIMMLMITIGGARDCIRQVRTLTCDTYNANVHQEMKTTEVITLQRLLGYTSLDVTSFQHLRRLTIERTTLTCEQILRREFTSVYLNGKLCKINSTTKKAVTATEPAKQHEITTGNFTTSVVEVSVIGIGNPWMWTTIASGILLLIISFYTIKKCRHSRKRPSTSVTYNIGKLDVESLCEFDIIDLKKD